jgi:RNA polymerase sigma-B factor
MTATAVRVPTADPDLSATDLLHTLTQLPTDHPDRTTARERAIEAWLPLAKHLAQRFHGRGEPLDDLVQIATIGLIKAIDRDNPQYGNDFAAYAVPTVPPSARSPAPGRTLWSVSVRSRDGGRTAMQGRQPTRRDVRSDRD